MLTWQNDCEHHRCYDANSGEGSPEFAELDAVSFEHFLAAFETNISVSLQLERLQLQESLSLSFLCL